MNTHAKYSQIAKQFPGPFDKGWGGGGIETWLGVVRRINACLTSIPKQTMLRCPKDACDVFNRPYALPILLVTCVPLFGLDADFSIRDRNTLFKWL